MYEKRNYAIAMNSDILKYSEKSVYNKGGNVCIMAIKILKTGKIIQLCTIKSQLRNQSSINIRNSAIYAASY